MVGLATIFRNVFWTHQKKLLKVQCISGYNFKRKQQFNCITKCWHFYSSSNIHTS